MKKISDVSVSVMFGGALVAPSAALAQFGPPPGPPPAFAGPPPGFGAGGPPPGLGGGGPPLDRLRAHLRAILQVLHLISRVSTVLSDRMDSIAAARPIFAASRVAPRPTAPTATLEIATPTMAMAVATGTLMRRRRRLTPMAEPKLFRRRPVNTSPHTGDTARGAFWSAMKTD